VISRSPTNIQPVLDAVTESAARLCETSDVVIFLRDGESLRLAAHHGPIRVQPTLPLVRGTSNGRAVLDGRTVHVVDMQIEADEFPEGSANARLMGHRTILCVPLMREGLAIGTIHLRRTEAQLFTDRQVGLLETFADQAVIAIENVRLFKELEARNRDLIETLDQQTATGEILRVISSSPTDVQPVLDTVAESAARLCESFDSAIWRRDDDRLLLVAHHGPIPVGPIGEFSLPLIRRTVAGRSVLDGRPVHVADAQAEVREFPESSDNARRMGFRTILSVPLMREGVAIGSIQIRRTEAQLFTERQVALLETFAEQAVIAIENVRLFRELEARNSDLTETLEQQTATSEILRVISGSPTDVQPVFDAVVENAVRLCDALYSAAARLEGGLIHLVAHYNWSAEGLAVAQRLFPMPPTQDHVTAHVVREGRMIHAQRMQDDPTLPASSRDLAIARAIRRSSSCPCCGRPRPSAPSSWRKSKGPSPTARSRSSRPSPTRP
jgi:GAF domain-containing protein